MAAGHLGVLLQHIHRLAADGRPEQPTDRQLLEDFAVGRDEAAFAELVARHGPMVLRVCRRVLRQEQDAEDAFQATFLVLAWNGGSIRKREALAGWLYGVAYRTAMKARRSAARRRDHEGRAGASAPRAAAEPTWNDVQAALDVEVERLPGPFRAAFVLCVLEGKGTHEAAVALGCKAGTVSSRVTRARRLLRERLARRGIALAAVLAALAVAGDTGRAAVPAALAKGAVRYGLLAAAGSPAGGTIPAHLAALAEGVTGAMFTSKLKVITAVLLAVALVAAAGALACQALAGREQPRGQLPPAGGQTPTPAAAEPPDDKAGGVEVSGRVVGPDGKSVAGAKLFIWDRSGRSPAPQPATDAEGRFRFALPGTSDLGSPDLLAMADGLGLDWLNLGYPNHPNDARNLTLRLPPDVPIRGRVVDLEGKPVAGATVRIVELSTAASGNLDEFLKQWAADKERSATGPAFRLLDENRLWPPEALGQLAKATTAPDGTFRLTGVGRDRGLMLGVRGPGIADQYVRVVTRLDFPARPVVRGQVALSGPEPAVVVGPSKPILGTLRDARTKEPLAGVRVLAYTPSRPIDWWWQPVETATDAQGRYRLDGLAKTDRQILAFDPGPGAPHMHRFDEVGDTDGFTPIVHDSELYRGVVVSGQVTDQSTGRPVRARVVYAPLITNGKYATTPGYDRPRTDLLLWIDSREMIAGADGRYRLTALPGAGALFVEAVSGAGPFTEPSVRKEDRDPAFYHAEGDVFMTLGLGDIFPLADLHAYRLIRPRDDATELTADFALDPGVRRRGRLLDPDGRPVSGAEVFNLNPPSAWKVVLPGAEFTAEALNPARPRRLLFWHHERRLAGTVVLRGDQTDPITVTLQPLAALTGRAIRKNGEPLVGYAVEYGAWPELEWPGQDKYHEREMLTDKEGRFRVTDLPAGVPLNVSVIAPKTRHAVIHRRRVVLEPGQTRDLGDLRGQPGEGEP
jgi:RNA polymerase sigma factor (sigma-70 family)